MSPAPWFIVIWIVLAFVQAPLLLALGIYFHRRKPVAWPVILVVISAGLITLACCWSRQDWFMPFFFLLLALMFFLWPMIAPVFAIAEHLRAKLLYVATMGIVFFSVILALSFIDKGFWDWLMD